MTDETRDTPSPENGGTPAPADPNAPVFQITIQLFQDGRIGLNGPMHDSVLCYGLLESAKDALRAYQAQQQAVAHVEAARRAPNLVLPSGFPRVRGQ